MIAGKRRSGIFRLALTCAGLCVVSAAQSLAQVQARDPFVSVLDLQQLNARADLSGLSLKGVIWESGHPVAIINDTLVCEGDMFSGFRMVKIDKDKVTLSLGKESYVLFVEAPSDQDKTGTGQGQENVSPGALALPENDLLDAGMPQAPAQDLPQNLPQEQPK